jgi:hypothetical protein
MAAGAGAVATLAALAVPAAAMGGPNPYEDAQVGLTYPVYQPMTVLGLPLTSFKLLPCAAGQDESVSATYGKAYTPISNFGKLPGFSIAEGYPDICANPGLSWQVGIWNVGIPKDMVSVKVSVYCDPAALKNCTVANGVKSGYVLQWAQPYRFGTSPAKQTQMFIDTSLLTLPQANSGPLKVQFRSGDTPIRFGVGGKTVSQLEVTGSSSVQVPVQGVGQLSIVLPNGGSDAGILDVTANSLS